MQSVKSFCVESGLLIGIVVIALSIRLWGIQFGLPYIYHPDEPRYVTSAQLLFKTHDVNPHSLPDISSSSFVYVVNALGYLPYYLSGKLSGVFQSPSDIPFPKMLTMGTGSISMPSAFLLCRSVTMLFGIANVVMVFLIGRRLFKNASIGLLAAFWLASSPANVTHSRLVIPDTFVVFFVLVLFHEAIRVAHQERITPYLVSGVALGCLISTKISGVLALIPFLAVLCFQRKTGRNLLFNLFILVISTLIAFSITTPYVFGDFGDVVRDILVEGHHYSSGHPGMEGNSMTWYVHYAWQTSGVLVIFALLEIMRGFILRSKQILLLSLFPVLYFLFISLFVVRNDRTFLPITPFIFLLASSFLANLLIAAGQIGCLNNGLRRVWISAAIGLTVVATSIPIHTTIKETIRLVSTDSRETARVWINECLPPGTRIAIEPYSPFVDPARFSVQSFGKMINYDHEWYLRNDFDFLIFSQGMYKRFYDEPGRYSVEISKYDRFFNQLTLLKRFTDGDYEIRIYSTLTSNCPTLSS